MQINAYKGFNKDMTCRDFQFEEGKTYEEPEAKMCENNYYPFHIRLKLAKMFEAWADEHKVEKCAGNVIAYLCMKGLLSYKDVKAFLSNEAKDGAE